MQAQLESLAAFPLEPEWLESGLLQGASPERRVESALEEVGFVVQVLVVPGLVVPGLAVPVPREPELQELSPVRASQC